MIVDGKIIDTVRKVQYSINREVAKILPSDQSRATGQAKFTYSPLGKAFEKQIKTVKEQGKNKLKL